MTVWIGLAAFAATFGGALLGMWAAGRLPRNHLGPDTRNVISISMAVVGTLVALVVSLLITEGSTTFTARADAVSGLAANIVRMDDILRRYGPDAADGRAVLRDYAQGKADELASASRPATTARPLVVLEKLDDRIFRLAPLDNYHRFLQQRAIQVIDSMSDERWLLVEKMSTAMPAPFLALLIFWLALLFVSFGLFAPRNATILAALLLCALAISGGIFMIVELANPSRGLIRVPTEPLAAAIREIRAGARTGIR
ncbi:MAG: hypothetical protein ABI376_11970 [Caulobacteraceae bacterium]